MHPEIYDALVELACEAKHRGFKRYSLKIIYDVLRYQILGGEKSHDYKLNYRLVTPSFMPLNKEIIQKTRLDLEGFVDVRKSRVN